MSPPATLGPPGPRAPEDHRVAQDTKASEVTPETVPVQEEEPQVRPEHLDSPEAAADPATLERRASPVTLVHLALVAVRDLPVDKENLDSMDAKERRGSLTTPTWVWGSKESSAPRGPEGRPVKLENLAETDYLGSQEPRGPQVMLATAQ